jgi:hypothetical protein
MSIPVGEALSGSKPAQNVLHRYCSHKVEFSKPLRFVVTDFNIETLVTSYLLSPLRVSYPFSLSITGQNGVLTQISVYSKSSHDPYEASKTGVKKAIASYNLSHSQSLTYKF